MSGSSLLIDTNIALYLLGGDQTLAEVLDGRDIYISFVTELELLGFPGISDSDLPKLGDFISDCIVVELNQSIKRLTVELKRRKKIKLPDAIIAASSIYMNLPLLSADKVFEKVEELQFVKYEIH